MQVGDLVRFDYDHVIGVVMKVDYDYKYGMMYRVAFVDGTVEWFYWIFFPLYQIYPLSCLYFQCFFLQVSNSVQHIRVEVIHVDEVLL